MEQAAVLRSLLHYRTQSTSGSNQTYNNDQQGC